MSLSMAMAQPSGFAGASGAGLGLPTASQPVPAPLHSQGSGGLRRSKQGVCEAFIARLAERQGETSRHA